MYMYVFLYVYIYTCVCIYIYVCVYIYIYIYIYFLNSFPSPLIADIEYGSLGYTVGSTVGYLFYV